MARPLKYLVGERYGDPLDVVSDILAGRYIIYGTKRQHPSWIGSMPLHQIKCATARGHLFRAVPNPEHKDNQK